MSDPADHRMWRNRFLLRALVQIAGTALALFGILLGRPGIIVAEPMPMVGLPVALVGVFIAFFGPRLLARRWMRDR